MRKSILTPLIALIFVGLGIAIGPTGLPMNKQVLLLRLIRVGLVFIAGLSLSVNGAALQSLFSNPLVDPHIMGISGGAALGFVVVSLADAPFYLCVLGGVAGGWFAAGLTYLLAVEGARVSRVRLILGGIAVGTFSSSLVLMLLAIKGESALHAIRFVWGYPGVVLTVRELMLYAFMGTVVVGSAFVMWVFARELDAIYLGDSEALAVGIDVDALKRRVFAISALSTGLLVSMIGIVGFVGLIVPHAVRRFLGTTLNRQVIPASALIGGAFAVAADTAARTVFPVELPLGIITSLIGVPIFVYLMRRETG